MKNIFFTLIAALVLAGCSSLKKAEVNMQQPNNKIANTVVVEPLLEDLF